MRIAIGSDHAGFDLKEAVKAHFKGLHHFVDVGTLLGSTSVDYPDFAEKVAQLVTQGTCGAGVLICGTGIGMSIAANKVPGIRAAVANDEFSARISKQHNHTNILCLGARVIAPDTAYRVLVAWLAAETEARHEGRIHKLVELEQRCGSRVPWPTVVP
jgi:ribose 5-phosphate isomerase B